MIGTRRSSLPGSRILPLGLEFMLKHYGCPQKQNQSNFDTYNANRQTQRD
jgi:hypothetical protein